MSREKKFVIAAGTFAGLVTVYFVVRKFRHRNDLSELDENERQIVQRVVGHPMTKRLKEELEEGAQDLPASQRMAWVRAKIRNFVIEHFGDHIDLRD